jgi:hypothetical protein
MPTDANVLQRLLVEVRYFQMLDSQRWERSGDMDDESHRKFDQHVATASRRRLRRGRSSRVFLVAPR